MLRSMLLTLLAVSMQVMPGHAAIVFGSLHDITIQALNTKLMFAPSTNVLLTPTGLSAGPPKTIDTSNGQFSLTLDAGDYTVSLPLIPWRKPFGISVPETNGALSITSLLGAPMTYTYTNNLNWLLAGTNLYYNAGRIGVGLSDPSAPLEIQHDSSASPKHLVLSATNPASAVAMEFKSPNSNYDWQFGVFSDVFKLGKLATADYLTVDGDGLVSVGTLGLTSGAALIHNDGSASFLDGAIQFGGGSLLWLRNDSSQPEPTQLLIESTDEGSVGVQFQSPGSTNNWQASVSNDNFTIGKVGLPGFLTINPAGIIQGAQGFAVASAIGISTNFAVLTPGPKTNVLVFTKGILTSVQ